MPPPDRRATMLAAVVLVAAGALSGSGRHEAAAADLDTEKARLEAVKAEIDGARDKTRALAAKADGLAAEARKTSEALVRIAREVQRSEAESLRIEENLRELARVEAETEAALQGRRADMQTTMAALQRLSRQPAATLVARPGAAIDTVRSATVMSRILPGLEGEAARLAADIQKIVSVRREIAHDKAALAQTLEGLGRERAELERLLAVKRKVRRETLEAAEKERARLAALAREATSLEDLVRKLTEEAARRARARPEPGPGITGPLPLPAPGRVIARFGDPLAGEAAGPSKGLTIETRAGGEVVAPHEGEVVFSGPFRGYGQLLIIAHGGGYHSLLAGMARTYATVGQWVLAGEPVGSMGRAGTGAASAVGGSQASDRPVLYVELRRQGKPVDPTPWLVASEGEVKG